MRTTVSHHLNHLSFVTMRRFGGTTLLILSKPNAGYIFRPPHLHVVHKIRSIATDVALAWSVCLSVGFTVKNR